MHLNFNVNFFRVYIQNLNLITQNWHYICAQSWHQFVKQNLTIYLPPAAYSLAHLVPKQTCNNTQIAIVTIAIQSIHPKISNKIPQ